MGDCPRCGTPGKPAARFCTRCGARLTASGSPGEAALLPVGARLQGGRYQIIGQLGQGGMGAIYLVRDAELFQRLCVVKQMRPFFSSASERRKAEEDFRREAEVLVRLNQPGHPRIPEVYGYFVEDGDQYLVLKYIEGESLEGRLERLHHPLSEAEVIRCAVEVVDALVYLHNRKPQPVIHRDIKPANIIVDREDRVWLVDFGLARAITGHGARVMLANGRTVAAGTPGYAPLEQWQMQASAKSDIYAMGATMHHLLTGQDPRDRFSTFAELDLSLLRSLSSLPPLAELRPEVRPALAALVARCLDADPKIRPTAAELKADLTRLSPTGSRFFDAAREWSPTLGDLIGTALAAFVRNLLGRPPAAVQKPPWAAQRPPAAAQRPSAATKKPSSAAQKASSATQKPTPPAPSRRKPADKTGRLTLVCLVCNGEGVLRNGRPCPVCRGSGAWWQEK
jgi:serine/threonine protein kinase